MIAKGQSPAAQQARLDVLCCPRHGHGFGQVSAWLSSVLRVVDPPGNYSLACCPRYDCDLVAKITAEHFETGPATIVTEADVHPAMWADAVAWNAHKRRRGPKS